MSQVIKKTITSNNTEAFEIKCRKVKQNYYNQRIEAWDGWELYSDTLIKSYLKNKTELHVEIFDCYVKLAKMELSKALSREEAIAAIIYSNRVSTSKTNETSNKLFRKNKRKPKENKASGITNDISKTKTSAKNKTFKNFKASAKTKAPKKMKACKL